MKPAGGECVETAIHGQNNTQMKHYNGGVNNELVRMKSAKGEGKWDRSALKGTPWPQCPILYGGYAR